MIRGGLWKKQGASSVCAFCRLRSQLSRPVRRQAYSSASNDSTLPGEKKQNGTGKTSMPSSAWGSEGDTWGGWGRNRESTTASTSSGTSSFDGLLPHERAAREQAMRIAVPTPAPPVRSTPERNPPRIQRSPDMRPEFPQIVRRMSPRVDRTLDSARATGEFPSREPQARAKTPIYNPNASDRPSDRHPRPSSNGGWNRPAPVRWSETRATSEPQTGFRQIKSYLDKERNGQENEEWGQLRRRQRNDSRSPGDALKNFNPAGPGPSAGSEERAASRPFWQQARVRLATDSNEPGSNQDRPAQLNNRPLRSRVLPDEGTNGSPWASQAKKQWQSVRPSKLKPPTGDNESLWAPTANKESRDKPTQLPNQPSALAGVSDAWDIPAPSPEAMEYETERRRGGRGQSDRLRERPEREKKPKARPRERHDDEREDDYDEDRAVERRRRKAERKAEKERRKLEALAAGPTPIFLPEYINVSNLAMALGVKQNQFVRQLEELGFEDISLESIMTGDTAALVAQEYGFEPTVDTGEGEDLKPRPPPVDPSTLPPRPPVVTIMGHVDHGKTTLLDYLRKSSVAAQEHGGITQHIGAFSVKMSSGKQITFLDTPGHAAFLTMRQRGANVTDIVILVVAADDSVKPQTIEALKHAQAAKVPIIVAINKIDKDEARVDQVKADLSRHGVEIEDYGGDVQVVCVSGKTGQGMADLEENILTLSEILDMRAETDGMAEGWVLESTIKSTGRVATVLVKRGTLRQGDFIVAGKAWTRIRTLRNEAGVDIEEAPPGTPVEILGWKDPPDAGDQVLQAPDEGKAKDAVHYRQELAERGEAVSQMQHQDQLRRDKEAADLAKSDIVDAETAEDQQPGTKLVNFVVKGDVHGSVEAVCGSILEIGNNEVQPRVLRSSPGHLTEYDVEHAATSDSHIINFNNQISGNIKRLAEDSGVKILDHTIIYHLVDDVKKTLSDYLTPNISTRVTGEAEVLQVFPINVKKRVYKNIAGCRVRNGAITRGGAIKYRVLRRGEKIFEGLLEQLMQGKKEATEIRKGAECGISLLEFDGFKEGDHIQAFEEVQEKRYL